VWTRLETTLEREWGAECSACVLQALEPLLRAEASEALAERDVPADLAGGWVGADLVGDLATLLEWPLKGKLVAAARRGAACPQTLEATISLYEATAADTVRSAGRRLVSYLWKLRP